MGDESMSERAAQIVEWVRDKDPRGSEALDQLLAELPEINPGYALPKVTGVVRYDSDLHTPADVARMTPHMQMLVARAHARTPIGRILITQTQAFPGDTLEDLQRLAASKGIRLVKGGK